MNNRLVDDTLQDVRYGARALRRRPGIALVTVLTMALGVGVTTVLFSTTYGVLMKPLPWPDADRLVRLTETRGGRLPRFGAFTNALYLTWRQRSTTLDELAGWSLRNVTLTAGSGADRVPSSAVSAGMLPMLGARVALGRPLRIEDELAGAEGVALLSHGLWQDRFGSRADIVDTVVQLDGQPHRIVGVLAPEFVFLDRNVRLWTPLRVPPVAGNSLSLFNAVAKLRPGVTIAQAAAEGRARGLAAPDTGMTTTAIFGGTGAIDVAMVPLLEAMTAEVRRPLLILLAAVTLLLVAAIANIASVQLAQASSRRRELALRAALGAGGSRIARQLVVENLLLGLCGGALGAAFAAALHRGLPALLPADFPRVADVGMNGIVVTFAALLSLGAGLVSGIVPLAAARRRDLAGSLAENGAAPVGSRLRVSTARLRASIIVAQVAIACVLLVGGALLARSLQALLDADRGYEPSGLMTARVALPGTLYSPEQRLAIVDAILARLSATGGVGAAAFTSELPLVASGSTAAFTMRSPVAGSGTITAQASPRIVSAGAFAALGMRIVEGRAFTEADTASSQPVIIVNRTFARRYLGAAAVGARLPMGVGYRDPVEGEVVGVVDDTRPVGGSDPPQPEMFFCHRQFGGRLPVPAVTVLIRTPGDPAALTGALRTAIGEAHSGLVAEALMTMEDRVLRGLARPRLYAVLLGGFAVCALLVAGVGLFGVLSFSVAERSREIAVRAALGARPARLILLVVGQGLGVIAPGIAIGLLAAALLTGMLSAVLYGITPHDTVTFLAVPAVLAAMSAVACFIPARRAASVNPASVLRG